MVPNPTHRLIPSGSDPYAYPYFHSNGTAPLLYELVDRFVADAKGERLRLLKRIQSRCIVKPTEISWRDSCGETALHRLCQKTSNLQDEDAVHMLLHVARAFVVACPQAITFQNNWKETPLHLFATHCFMTVACCNDGQQQERLLGHVVDLVRLLLNEHVAACPNYMGSLPLHTACVLAEAVKKKNGQVVNHNDDWAVVLHTAIIRHLVKLNPDALYVADRSGMTPLHHAAFSETCSPQVVQVLLDQILSQNTNDRQMNIESRTELCKGALARLRRLYFESGGPGKTPIDYIERALRSSLEGIPKERMQRCIRNFDALWTKTVLLIQTGGTLMLSTKPAQQEPKLVHSSMMLSASLAVVLATVSLNQPELLQADGITNKTPLIMALLNTPVVDSEAIRRDLEYDHLKRPFYACYCNGDWIQRPHMVDSISQRILLSHLIATEPRAARVVDGNGRLPLHYAAENGVGWQNGLEILFEAEPRAVAARDPVTHLYPFCLAATASRNEPDASQVSDIFELLRADPCVLNFS